MLKKLWHIEIGDTDFYQFSFRTARAMGGGIPFRTALRERLGIINVSEEKVHRIMIVCFVVQWPNYMYY